MVSVFGVSMYGRLLELSCVTGRFSHIIKAASSKLHEAVTEKALLLTFAVFSMTVMQCLRQCFKET